MIFLEPRRQVKMQAWETKVVKENSTEISFQIKIPVAAAIGRLIDHTILYMFSYVDCRDFIYT